MKSSGSAHMMMPTTPMALTVCRLSSALMCRRRLAEMLCFFRVNVLTSSSSSFSCCSVCAKEWTKWHCFQGQSRNGIVFKASHEMALFSRPVTKWHDIRGKWFSWQITKWHDFRGKWFSWQITKWHGLNGEWFSWNHEMARVSWKITKWHMVFMANSKLNARLVANVHTGKSGSVYIENIKQIS